MNIQQHRCLSVTTDFMQSYYASYQAYIYIYIYIYIYNDRRTANKKSFGIKRVLSTIEFEQV